MGDVVATQVEKQHVAKERDGAREKKIKFHTAAHLSKQQYAQVVYTGHNRVQLAAVHCIRRRYVQAGVAVGIKVARGLDDALCEPYAKIYVYGNHNARDVVEFEKADEKFALPVASVHETSRMSACYGVATNEIFPPIKLCARVDWVALKSHL